jgi:NifB/MoaA-like Fe-S oxidoreductase
LVVLTGTYGGAVLEPVKSRLEHLAGRDIRILVVPNDYFGGNTAVAGLMVGEDIIKTITSDSGPVGAYVIPDVALSGDAFIDDVPLAAVAEVATAPVVIAPATAAGLVGAAR